MGNSQNHGTSEPSIPNLTHILPNYRRQGISSTIHQQERQILRKRKRERRRSKKTYQRCLHADNSVRTGLAVGRPLHHPTRKPPTTTPIDRSTDREAEEKNRKGWGCGDRSRDGTGLTANKRCIRRQPMSWGKQAQTRSLTRLFSTLLSSSPFC